MSDTQPWVEVKRGVWERKIPHATLQVTVPRPWHAKARWRVYFPSGKIASWGRTDTLGEAVRRSVQAARNNGMFNKVWTSVGPLRPL